MENTNAIEEQKLPSLLDSLTTPLSADFGYLVVSFLAVYIYTCTLLFI